MRVGPPLTHIGSKLSLITVEKLYHCESGSGLEIGGDMAESHNGDSK